MDRLFHGTGKFVKRNSRSSDFLQLCGAFTLLGRVRTKRHTAVPSSPTRPGDRTTTHNLHFSGRRSERSHSYIIIYVHRKAVLKRASLRRGKKERPPRQTSTPYICKQLRAIVPQFDGHVGRCDVIWHKAHKNFLLVFKNRTTEVQRTLRKIQDTFSPVRIAISKI